MKRTIGTFGAGVLVTAMASVVSAQPGQPFERLWQAIATLTSRVAALESAPPSSGPLRVYNGSGAAIGLWLPGDTVLHHDGTYWFSIGRLATGGFGNGFVGFLYDQPGCTGNRYLPGGVAGETPLTRTVTAQSGVGYYAADPLQNVTVRSRHFSNGSCNATPPPETLWVGPVGELDLSTLGPPPFSIQ
jgi:hypothetical protein